MSIMIVRSHEVMTNPWRSGKIIDGLDCPDFRIHLDVRLTLSRRIKGSRAWRERDDGALLSLKAINVSSAAVLMLGPLMRVSFPQRPGSNKGIVVAGYKTFM